MKVDIGYVCAKGHFQFNDDPDGDSCRTKEQARIVVEGLDYLELPEHDLKRLVAECLHSHHQKMEEWRRG